MNNRITDDLEGIECTLEDTSPAQASNGRAPDGQKPDPEQTAMRTLQASRQQRLKEFGEALNLLQQQKRCRLYVWQEMVNGIPQGVPEIRVAVD